ncbi:TolC family protein [Sediminicoccus sp. KRV36]|uniref:TolC family protein n=1 Tax=Sediminicoccus sp. KRV36 TaxID=3133721 RepID=UPI00201054F7|nr:TolC family protein [Sediminicoccus rosea]UPY37841.1 TolC family protein [Sediminicoccus rosea]
MSENSFATGPASAAPDHGPAVRVSRDMRPALGQATLAALLLGLAAPSLAQPVQGRTEPVDRVGMPPPAATRTGTPPPAAVRTGPPPPAPNRSVSGLTVPAPARGQSAEPLTLRNFARLLFGADEQILVQRLEAEIARERVRGAEALYEPVFNLTTSYDSSYVLNTSNEILQRANQATYGARIYQVNSSITTRLPVGTDVEIGYNVGRIRNTLQPIVGARSPEYRAWFGMRLTQPLLANAGPDATNRPIHVAQFERDMAREAVRQVSAQRVVEGISTYLATQRAEGRVRIRARIVELTETLARDLRAQEDSGLRSSGEVMGIDVSVAQRQAALQQAQQDLEEQMGDLQARLSARDLPSGQPQRPRRYAATDALVLTAQRIPLPEMAPGTGELPRLFAESLAQRPESRFMDNRLSRDDVEVRFARNQTLPELNFIARAGIEDLNTNNRYRAISEYAVGNGVNYGGWMVGLQLRAPLYGDNRRQAELSQARLRQGQTVIAQRAVQQRIVNEVTSSINVLNRVMEMVEQQQTAYNQQRRLVALDENLLRQGRRSRVEVIRRQIEALEAQEQMLDSVMLANRAGYVASLSRGDILRRLELE